MKNAYWKNIPPYYKFIALMFHYRLRTEPLEDVMSCYIESYRYCQFGIKTELLPDYIFKCKPEILIKDAYEAIGRRYCESV